MKHSAPLIAREKNRKYFLMCLALMINILFIACAFVKEKGNEKKGSIFIELKSVLPITVKNENVTFVVYGYDALLMDASATKILETSMKLKELPTTVEFKIPLNSETLIKPEISAIENVSYYLHVTWDNNNNGKVDKGDLMIDHDKNFGTVNVKSTEKQTIYIKALK